MSTTRLTLVPSLTNSTGWKGVSYRHGAKKPFSAAIRQENGEVLNLGSFTSKERAATAYARHLGPAASFEAAEKELQQDVPILSKVQVEEAAAAEDLALVRSSTSSTGYSHVSFHVGADGRHKYFAECRVGSYKRNLGCFPSKEQAALAYARYLGPEASVELAAAAEKEASQKRALPTEAEVRHQAAAEGLTLVVSSRDSGFQGVRFLAGRKTKPWQAMLGSKYQTIKHLGYFDTRFEAALAYARKCGSAASATAEAGPSSSTTTLTEKQAEQQAALMGLTLHRSTKSATGFLNVHPTSGGNVKPYKVCIKTGRASRRTKFDLGYYDSAPEAALAYARALGHTSRTAMRAAAAGSIEQEAVEEEAANEADGAAEAEVEEGAEGEEEDAGQYAERLDAEGIVEVWERFEVRCVLSFQRLVDPAKGSNCIHRACCNYKELRDHVGRCSSGNKRCPTCDAKILRTRDVERDVSMHALLQQVPTTAGVVWLRGNEVRTTDPTPATKKAPRKRRLRRNEPRAAEQPTSNETSSKRIKSE